MKAITLNNEQQLYVIPSSTGYSCFGFKNCFDQTTALAALLAKAAPTKEEFGTLELYQRNLELVKQYAATPAINQKTWFEPGTAEAVRSNLDDLIHNQSKVRLFLGDASTGLCWLEEYDTIGRIGRSMGPMRVPLLITPGADGGGAILTASIVRIMTSKRENLYLHPNFHTANFETKEGNIQDLPYEIWIDGSCHARFKTATERTAWRLFMRGDIFDYLTPGQRKKLDR
jgi:hypothetical protein